MRFYRLILYACVIIPTASFAATEPGDDLFSMDLKTLSELTVSIGAVESERIKDTPFIATRYETSKMQGMGLSTLEDLLSFVPGVIVQDSAIGTKAVMIRGIVEAFNQKVLFLLDGVPYWQPSHGDFPILGMPFVYIDRVEVIRGPGAVIYGTNASGGVINVITKSSRKSEVELAVGNQETRSLGIYHHRKSDEIVWMIGGHSVDQHGFDATFENRPLPPIYPADSPTTAHVTKAEKSYSFWTNLKAKNWNTGIHHYRSETNGLAAAASAINENSLEYTGTLFYGNVHQMTGIGKAKVFADWNNFYLNIPTKNLIGFGTDGTQQLKDNGSHNNRYRVGFNLDTKLNKSLNWLNGLETEKRETGHYRNIDEQGNVASTSMSSNDTDETSLYSQLNYSWPKSRRVIGARYIENEKAGASWVPRLSLVRQLSHGQSIKLLYSAGFNSPNFIQQYINIPPNILTGDENLKAEKVSTLELAYNLQFDQHLFVANIYQLTTEDFIFRSVNDSGQVVFSNTKSYVREGVELDYRYKNQSLDLFINGSWFAQGNENLSSDSTAKFVPKITVNTGLVYSFNSVVSAGTSVRTISERDTASKIMLWNANTSVDFKQWSASFTIENILGEDVLHPDVQNFAPDKLVPAADNAPLYLFTLKHLLSLH